MTGPAWSVLPFAEVGVMRMFRKFALVTIAAGIVIGTLSGGSALASTNTVHPLCGSAVCWQ
jgi:hypothetical protein